MTAQVQSILDNKTDGVISKLEKVVNLLESRGWAEKIVLKPQQLVCHPSNRGSSMVNAWDCWKKGLNILSTGLKPSLLAPNSLCVELARKPVDKKQQLLKNEELMDASENCLGRMTNSERYLTLGSSHFVYFCRALQQGAVPPGGEKLQIPEEMTALLSTGWSWTVLKAEVEESFPSFPGWAATALNSVNSNSKAVSELEAMLEIASLLKQGKKMTECVELLQEGMPSCSDYMEDLAYFVKLYAGGDGCPVLHQLKEFCCLNAFTFLCHCVK